MEEVLMPWMPEVFTAPIAEARRAQEEAALVNDTVPYYEGIMANEPDALIRSFAGQPVLNDPRVGRVEGARGLRDFVSEMAGWLRERDAVVENVALTRTQTRTVEEVAVYLLADDGRRIELPVAIVTDRNPNRTVKGIRVYHSMWPLTGEHAVRPPLLTEDPRLHAEGSPGDYQRATWKASWGPSNPMATPVSRAEGRTYTGASRVYGSDTSTCLLTAAVSLWSTAPSPTTACGAPSSTTACGGEQPISRPRQALRCTSEGTAGYYARRGSTMM
jgi:hypothetical protein